MTLLYYDSLFLEHRTGAHPGATGTIDPGGQAPGADGFGGPVPAPAWGPVSLARLGRIHAPEYAAAVKPLPRPGAGGSKRIRSAARAPTKSHFWRPARSATQSSGWCAAKTVRRCAWCGRPGTTPSRTRPWASACSTTWPSARAWPPPELGLDHVLIVDWDVHHGNGTQAAFWRDGQVGFLSIHRWPFYPGTGRADETGSGPGLRAPSSICRWKWERVETNTWIFSNPGWTGWLPKSVPNWCSSAPGSTATATTPDRFLGLGNGRFIPLTEAVLEIAWRDMPAEKSSAVLEGGYNTGVLAGCVEVHLHTLLRDRPIRRAT